MVLFGIYYSSRMRGLTLALLAMAPHDAVTQGCGIIAVRVPPAVLQQAGSASFVGLYTLQYETYDERPVYRQYTWLCNPDQVMASKVGANSIEQLGCKKDSQKGSEAHKKHYLYYDETRHLWKLGPAIGSDDVVLVAKASGKTSKQFPYQLPSNSWQLGISRTPGKGIKSLVKLKPTAGVSMQCMDGAAAKLSKGSSIALHQISKPLDPKVDSKCISWRKTGGCDPDGPRQKEHDKSCDKIIRGEWSGFCECASGIKHKVACGHSPFTCETACQVSFPFVLAASAERTWTNQFARNIVRPGGDWLSSAPKKQWLEFDLGGNKHVQALRFDLWGSTASPRHCSVSRAKSYEGPWHKVGKPFEIPKQTRFTQHVGASARYWRLDVADNWGASWGVGFNRLRFVDTAIASEATPDVCMKYKDCNSCVYSEEDNEMVQENRYCGWCPEQEQCLLGSPHGPSQASCAGKWLWTECDASDHCSAFTGGGCGGCTDHLDCGWCAADKSCKSGGCSKWADRSCGNATLATAKDRRYPERASTNAAVEAAVQEELKDVQERTYVAEGLGVATAGLLALFVLLSRAQKRASRKALENRTEIGVQYDARGLELDDVDAIGPDNETAPLMTNGPPRSGGGTLDDDGMTI